MPLLPIVERELRERSRQPAGHRARFWTAAASMLVGTLMVITARQGMPPHSLARALFIVYGSLALSFAMLSGLFLTADCLSSEKREQTLGLLFLTDLKGYDVVLGKLAATSVQSLYALLGLFPIIAVPLLMGGITGGAVVRLALTLLVTMFFSLSTGMVVSALSRETRQAILGTLGLLVGISGVFPMVYGIVIALTHAEMVGILYPCPVFTFISGLDDFYQRPMFGRHSYWSSLGLVSVMGLGFLSWACKLSRRLCQDEARETGDSTNTLLLREWRFGTAQWRKALRFWLDRNPLYWLFHRDRLTQRMCLAVFSLLSTLWLLLFLFAVNTQVNTRRERDTAMVILICLSFGMHLILKCFIAVEASRRVAEDAQNGALELLATTPIRNEQFLSGFKSAIEAQFFFPTRVLFLLNLLLAFVILVFDPVEMRNAKSIFFWGFFLGAFIVHTDFHAIAWTSLKLALRGKRHHWVIFGALGRVLLAPWAVIGILMLLMGQANAREATVRDVICIWLFATLFVGLVQGTLARQQAQEGFRENLARLYS
jgi:hypothetical protein